MVFDRAVKMNGVWYAAGMEVPAKVETVAVEEKQVEAEAEKIFTKSDVQKMNKETLVELAKAVGVEDAEKKTITALRKLIVEKYNL